MADTRPGPVDAVFVAYDSEAVIGRGLARALELGGRAVVLDHGDGASADVAQAMGATVVRNPSNPGFGSGQNRGVRLSGSEFVLLCNPDAEIVPAAVQAGAELLCARADVAAVQGVIVHRESRQPERSAGIQLSSVHLVGRALGAKALMRVGVIASLMRRSPALQDHVDRAPRQIVEVESLAATAMLVRRSAFEAVGGFDESFFLYGEDMDLCRRLRASGWKLLALPDLWAVHDGGASAASTWGREVSWWEGTMRYTAGWWGSREWCVGVLAATTAWARLSVRHPSRARQAYIAMVGKPASVRRSSRRRKRMRRHPSSSARAVQA